MRIETDFWDTLYDVAKRRPELAGAARMIDDLVDGSVPEIGKKIETMLDAVALEIYSSGYEDGKERGWEEREEWEDERRQRRDLERQFI